MQRAFAKDVVGGLMLAVFGAATALYAYFTLPMGSISRVGPGLLPVSLSVMIAVLGSCVALLGYHKAARVPQPEWATALTVSSGMLGFALTIGRFGLIPAVAVLVLVCTIADKQQSLRGRLVLVVCLCLLAVLLFLIALGLPVALFHWRL